MTTCKYCCQNIFFDGKVWTDMTGGDVCPINETPVYDDTDKNRLVEMKSGNHEPNAVAKK